MIGRTRRVLLAGAAGGVLAVVACAGSASAHPLGNFSVNHAHALRITPDHVVDDAVVDIAEIPTAQAEGAVDVDGDGTESPGELADYGAQQCAALLGDLTLTVDSIPTPLELTRSSFARLPGAAGLTTTRLECRLEATIAVRAGIDLALVDRFESDRIGWHEITATADGAHLIDAPVPTRSPTDGLRSYPVDLLRSPMNVREATLRVAPGGSTAAAAEPTASRPGAHEFSSGGPLSGIIEPVNRVFDDLIGRHELTLGVGLLAVALALVLGASHALLPGHGKTVMAAYIAGRQGTSRDAFVVGATVTATHTGGVLILGLALTLSSSLAGESVLAWLGVASGLLIAMLGASLLVSTLRHRETRFTLGHHHGPNGHHHGPNGHDHGPSDHHHQRAPRRPVQIRSHATREPASDRGGVAVLAKPRTVVVRHVRDTAAPAPAPAPSQKPTQMPTQKPTRTPNGSPVSRRSLVGMGIAGGLVPSPSALVVLLSAIALGRTAFGILLVVGYGLGMAATLTAAGLLLVKVRDRFQHRSVDQVGRVGRAAARWQRVSPYLTASLVLVVGAGLALRSLGGL